MKNILSVLSICIASTLMLAACSTNTRQENTLLGAASGAVVGGLAGGAIGSGGGAVAVGAVAGAIIGGVIGNSMESSDNTRMTHVMNNNGTNHATRWSNSHNGVRYSVKPTSRVMAYKGYSHCRSYTSTAIINGKKQMMTGVACRQADGSWRTM
ncbi:MAG: hypothetical protein A3F14_01760 [Gammaproteobacteria bacterium RIFCSPHIGHO2_12_FULL_43_28]|nr:MAG: hypothetical protein A3F14_01760 [Gammaproteobacteria bacterium RIFCSPHIGHO2_12_FULL_43_28]